MYFTFEKAYYMPTIKINSVGSSFGHFDDVILIVKAALCFLTVHTRVNFFDTFGNHI